MKTNRTHGFWILMIAGIFLLAMLLLGQTMSFIDYEFTVEMGLQEPKEEITQIGVALNKGFGVGDTLVYIPLLVTGLAGLWRKRMWGVFAMSGALAITVYWPVVSIFMLFFARGAMGFHFTRYASYGVILGLITLYGGWGLWYVYTHHKTLTSV